MTDTLYIANDGSIVPLLAMVAINAKLAGRYCAKQARMTPTIPTHNVVWRAAGMVCLACGKSV